MLILTYFNEIWVKTDIYSTDFRKVSSLNAQGQAIRKSLNLFFCTIGGIPSPFARENHDDP